MAVQTEVGVKITVDGSQAQGSVGNIKKELKLATAELIAARAKFGELSDEAIAAAKRVADLKDEIGDAKDLVNAFNPDAKFKAFGAAVQGVVGGFTALQGAFALFGNESEAVNESLKKVQGALALSQGIDQILEAQKSFETLGKILKGFPLIQKAITAAQFLWNAATAANPIGALVTVVVALIAAGAALIAFFISSAKEAKAMAKSVDQNVKALENQTKAAERSADQLQRNQKYQLELAKANGATTKEIRALELKLIDEKIAMIASARATALATVEKNKNYLATLKQNDASEDLIKKQQEVTNESVAEANKQTKNLDNANIEKIELIRKQNIEVINENRAANKKQADENDKKIAKDKETTQKSLELERDFQGKLRQLRQQNALDSITDETERAKKQAQFAFENAEQEINNSKFSEQKKNQLISELKIKYNSDIAKIDKDAATKQGEIDKKLGEDRLAAQAKTDELITQARSASFKNEFDKREFDLSVQVQGEIDAQTDLLNKKLINEETYRQNIALIDEKYAGQFAGINADRNKAAIDAEIKAAQERIKIAQEELNAKVQISNQNADIAVGLANLLKSTNEKSKGVAIASLLIEQAAAISKIITSTQVANLGALATPQAILTGGASAAPVILRNNIMAGISIATAIASVVKGINQIKSASSSGSGGGGGAALPASSMAVGAPIPPQAQTTTLNQSQVNQIGNAAARAYIVESDVTGSQERIQRLNRAARIA